MNFRRVNEFVCGALTPAVASDGAHPSVPAASCGNAEAGFARLEVVTNAVSTGVALSCSARVVVGCVAQACLIILLCSDDGLHVRHGVEAGFQGVSAENL